MESIDIRVFNAKRLWSYDRQQIGKHFMDGPVSFTKEQTGSIIKLTRKMRTGPWSVDSWIDGFVTSQFCPFGRLMNKKKKRKEKKKKNTQVGQLGIFSPPSHQRKRKNGSLLFLLTALISKHRSTRHARIQLTMAK